MIIHLKTQNEVGKRTVRLEDGCAVESTGCSSRGPGFGFQHPQGDSQPFGDPVPIGTPLTYMQSRIHKQTNDKKKLPNAYDIT